MGFDSPSTADQPRSAGAAGLSLYLGVRLLDNEFYQSGDVLGGLPDCPVDGAGPGPDLHSIDSQP